MKKVAPDWMNACKGTAISMREIVAYVLEIDTHFEGKLMALKAIEAQNVIYKKTLASLRAETDKVLKAFEGEGTHENWSDITFFQRLIQSVWDEDSKAWDKGVLDVNKASNFINGVRKDWLARAKKTKDKKIKKIVVDSKAPVWLANLSKAVLGLSAAHRGFMGHNAKFNQAYLGLTSSYPNVDSELKKASEALKSLKASADLMSRTGL